MTKKIKLILFSVFITYNLLAFENNLINASQHKVDSTEIDKILKKANFYTLRNPNYSRELATKAAEYSIKNVDLKREAQAYQIISIASRNSGMYYSGIRFTNSAIKTYKQIGNNQLNIAWCNHSLALTYYELGHYYKAYLFETKAHDTFKQYNNSKGMSETLVGKGKILFEINNLDKALECYNSAINLVNKEDTTLLSDIHYNISEVYREKNNLKKAIEHIKKGEEISITNKDTLGLAKYNSQIGSIYYKQKKYHMALKSQNEALKKYTLLSNKYGEAISLFNIGKCYDKLKNNIKALEYTNNSYSISKEIRNYKIEINTLESLYEIYFKLKEYKKAYEHHKRYKKLNDSLLSEKNKILKYILEQDLKVEQSILSKKQEIEQETRNIIITTSIITIVLLILLLITFFSNIRIKKKTNKILIQNNNLIQVQKKKIIKSLNELKNKEEELNIKNNSKNLFFKIISENIEKPIKNIIGFSEILKKDFKEFNIEQKKEFILYMNNYVSDIHQLLENLISWSVLNNNNYKTKPKEINLFSFVNNIIKNQKNYYKSKNVEVINNINSTTFLFTDYICLEIVLRNLISNAIKYSHENDKIIINGKKLIENYVINISDNGVGIKEDDKRKIFNLKYNYKTLGTNNESSAGLGLILSKDYIEKIKGTIWFDSEVYKGSTFYVSIPFVHIKQKNIL